MSKLYRVVCIILGLLIIGSGTAMLILGGPPVEYPSEGASNFMDAFVDAGYFIPFLAIVKIIVGISLVSNRFVAFTAVAFFLVAINMVMFHLFLEFAAGIAAYMILAANVYILIKNIDVYKPMFKVR